MNDFVPEVSYYLFFDAPQHSMSFRNFVLLERTWKDASNSVKGTIIEALSKQDIGDNTVLVPSQHVKKTQNGNIAVYGDPIIKPLDYGEIELYPIRYYFDTTVGLKLTRWRRYYRRKGWNYFANIQINSLRRILVDGEYFFNGFFAELL